MFKIIAFFKIRQLARLAFYSHVERTCMTQSFRDGRHQWSRYCLPPGTPEFTPGFQWGACYSIFSFMCMFCRQLFVLLSFFFCPLCCLFFFDLRILSIPLLSSNSSFTKREEDLAYRTSFTPPFFLLKCLYQAK